MPGTGTRGTTLGNRGPTFACEPAFLRRTADTPQERINSSSLSKHFETNKSKQEYPLSSIVLSDYCRMEDFVRLDFLQGRGKSLGSPIVATPATKTEATMGNGLNSSSSPTTFILSILYLPQPILLAVMFSPHANRILLSSFCAN